MKLQWKKKKLEAALHLLNYRDATVTKYTVPASRSNAEKRAEYKYPPVKCQIWCDDQWEIMLWLPWKQLVIHDEFEIGFSLIRYHLWALLQLPLAPPMPSVPQLIEADARSDSDGNGVNEVLVEDPAIVCHSGLSAAETSCLGRAEMNQGWRGYGGWAGGETEVLPSATPPTLLHPPSSASWADVGKCVRNSNVFL